VMEAADWFSEGTGKSGSSELVPSGSAVATRGGGKGHGRGCVGRELRDASNE
jgi:hypothetical protein